jgi:hypothetical protein
MMTRVDRWWLWLALNAGGIALFFVLAVKTWIEPELANVPGASGGAFIVWGTTAFPLFVLFIAANLVLGFKALRELVFDKRRRGTIIVALTLVAWIAAFYFDGIHHGI